MTTAPRSRARIPGRTARVSQYGASAFTSKVRRMPSSVASSRRTPVTTPALFTATSTSPARAAAASTAAASVTSTRSAWASAP